MSNIVLYCWLLPILFMIHDFEELIIIEHWKKRYKKEIENAQFKPFDHFVSTAAGAIAIFIEFLLFSGVAIYAYISANYTIWYAAFFAFTLHFIAHIVMSLLFRHYTPGLLTTCIGMPFCIYILVDAIQWLNQANSTLIITTVIVVILAVPFLKMLTTSIAFFQKLLDNYSEK